MSDYNDKQIALLERIASALEDIASLLEQQSEKKDKKILNG